VQEVTGPIRSVLDLMLFNSHQSALSAFIRTVQCLGEYPTWNLTLTRAFWIVIPDNRGKLLEGDLTGSGKAKAIC
jgi:hypothetical protein